MKIKNGKKAPVKHPAKVRVHPAISAGEPLQSPFETFIKNNALLVFTLAELLVIFIVFHKFLLLENTYLFKDEAADTCASYWPWYVNLSEYIRHTGIPKWSFNWGMGKNIYPLNVGNPFTFMLYLLPKNSIPYGIIFVESLKIFLGGLFFFLFLRTLKMPAFTSITGGLLYSFCGFMIIGSEWHLFSVEAVYASLLLYCLEKFLSQGSWYLVPIPFFLFAAFNPFMLYFYGLLTAIYCVAKIAANDARPDDPFGRGWQWKKMFLTLTKIGALALAGIIISSFVFLSDMDMLIHTPRGFGGEGGSFKTMLSTSIFSTSSFVEILTTLYRFFSNDFMGAGDCFWGWHDFIDAPALYTGLITGLLMPQAFIFMGKRKRIIYLGLTILAILPLIFPFLRHTFWLFSGDYYRTYSLFVSMLFLFLCLKTLSALDTKRSINPIVLFITLAVLLLIIWFLPLYYDPSSPRNYEPGYKLTKTLRKVLPGFLIIYTCLIYLISRKSLVISRKSFLTPYLIRLTTYDLRPLLGICILTELSFFSFITSDHRALVSNEELHEKIWYNDYTNDAVSFINTRETGFYRIYKDYSSSPSWSEGGYNDGLIQNYMTSSIYDSFNQPNYFHFLEEMNVMSVEETNRKWISPSRTRPLLSVFFNEKYVLTKHNYPRYRFFCDSTTTIGDVTIAKNKLYLPFGYTYQNYITLSEFRKLNDFNKDIMLLRAFVADSQDIGTIHESSLHQLYAKDSLSGYAVSINEVSNFTDVLRKDSLSKMVYTQNTVKGSIRISQAKLLFLTIPYDKGWELKVDGSIVKTFMVNIGFTGVMLAPGEHTIELNYEPPYLKLGCYISGFGLLGYLFIFITYRKKRFSQRDTFV